MNKQKDTDKSKGNHQDSDDSLSNHAPKPTIKGIKFQPSTLNQKLYQKTSSSNQFILFPSQSLQALVPFLNCVQIMRLMLTNKSFYQTIDSIKQVELLVLRQKVKYYERIIKKGKNYYLFEKNVIEGNSKESIQVGKKGLKQAQNERLYEKRQSLKVDSKEQSNKLQNLQKPQQQFEPYESPRLFLHHPNVQLIQSIEYNCSNIESQEQADFSFNESFQNGQISYTYSEDNDQDPSMFMARYAARNDELFLDSRALSAFRRRKGDRDYDESVQLSECQSIINMIHNIDRGVDERINSNSHSETERRDYLRQNMNANAYQSVESVNNIDNAINGRSVPLQSLNDYFNYQSALKFNYLNPNNYKISRNITKSVTTTKNTENTSKQSNLINSNSSSKLKDISRGIIPPLLPNVKDYYLRRIQPKQPMKVSNKGNSDKSKSIISDETNSSQVGESNTLKTIASVAPRKYSPKSQLSQSPKNQLSHSPKNQSSSSKLTSTKYEQSVRRLQKYNLQLLKLEHQKRSQKNKSNFGVQMDFIDRKMSIEQEREYIDRKAEEYLTKMDEEFRLKNGQKRWVRGDRNAINSSLMFNRQGSAIISSNSTAQQSPQSQKVILTNHQYRYDPSLQANQASIDNSADFQRHMKVYNRLHKISAFQDKIVNKVKKVMEFGSLSAQIIKGMIIKDPDLQIRIVQM